MARLDGRGPSRERVAYAVAHGHRKTATSVAALRPDGLLAPLVVDGALDGAAFRAYVEQHLAPARRPGDVLVMGNLATHKVAGVAAAVEARGCRLPHLPPYSPDLSPIEQVFSEVRAGRRRRERRTVRERADAFGDCLDWITPADARGYFRHAGYPPG